jgi:outer membrane receptor protein involved in Fe transport
VGCGLAAPSHPRAQPIAVYGRPIPNSPTNVIDVGRSAARDIGWYATLRARHLGESPRVEDNSARSPEYTTLDAELGFHAAHHWQAALDVFNLGDAGWNDIEYYYVSRLRTETVPQADYVAHPGVPRTLRAHVQYQFWCAGKASRCGNSLPPGLPNGQHPSCHAYLRRERCRLANHR